MSEVLPKVKAIEVPEFFGLRNELLDVLDVMLNHAEFDYSTVVELAKVAELALYSQSEITAAVEYLTRRGFLLKIEKSWGEVYAVNKLTISNMMFIYQY